MSLFSRRNIFLFLLAVSLAAVVLFFRYYRMIFLPNTGQAVEESVLLHIPTGSTYRDVAGMLDSAEVLKDDDSFAWLAGKKNYPNHVHPGRYRITKGMSNNQIIDMLRSGNQEPVQVIFNNIRSVEKLASVISAQIEADSASIMSAINDEELISSLGLRPETVIGIFIPNTYEFYWNTSAESFVRRMDSEYHAFWNQDRKEKARSIGLSPMEVITLASIVDEETIKQEENPRIAGVYMNRLDRGIKLDACPTLKFATGDWTIQRVLKVHQQVESPYNTYKYRGLPPGPIRIPSINAIDAVLDYERHDYYYFCAKDDFSGYHSFARTLDQHNKNARSYQKALNQRKIYN